MGGVSSWVLALFLALWVAVGCEDTTQGAGEVSEGDAGVDARPDLDLAQDLGDAPDEDDAQDEGPDGDSAQDAEPDADDAQDLGDAQDGDVARDVPEDEPPVDLVDWEVEEGDSGSPDADGDVPVVLPGEILVLGVEPAVGPVEGGTLLRIEVLGELAEPFEVQLGGRSAFEVRLGGVGELLAVSPPGVLGPMDVKVRAGEAEDTLEDGFRYIAALGVVAVAPARGSTEGGELVEVRGRSFLEPGLAVSFGGRSALGVEVLDDETLFAITPAREAGPADVRVSNDDSTSAVLGGFLYEDPTQIEGIFPAAGPTRGGNTVVLTGRGLREGGAVWFGGAQAQGRRVDDRRWEVVVPPGAEGVVDVAFLGESGSAGRPGGYAYVRDELVGLVVTGVDPARGPQEGGQVVTISGQGLDEDGLEVRFGGEPARLLEVTGSALRVRTPAHAPGEVVVEVSHEGGEARSPVPYVYLPTLRLDAVEPGVGPSAGGEAVVVRGEGFDAQTRFWIGPLEVEGVEVEDGQTARMVTPPGSLGPAAVRAVSGERSARLEGGYRYEDPFVILDVVPRRGSVAGGTLLTVLGRGFQEGAQVAVDRVGCSEVRVVDQTRLTCRTPPHREGSVPVDVRQGERALRAGPRFAYFHPGSRFGGAWGEEVDGSLNVTVFSVGGSPVPGAFVMLTVDGSTRYQGQTDGQGLITFSGEDVLGEQFVSVTAAGYSSASVQAVDAENLTVLLFPTSPPSGGGGGGSLPLATITGEVAGFQKIAQPGPGERQLIIVETSQLAPEIPNPWPGDGNIVDPNGESRVYTLNSRVGDVAVVAWGGLINDDTGVFTPYAMGIRRYLFVSQNETYTVDLELEIDLTTPLTVKVPGAHTGELGPSVRRVEPWIDLGFEGFVGGYDVAEGEGEVLVAQHQAPLEGALADASYRLFGGSAQPNFRPPYSLSRLEGVTQVEGIIEMPRLIGTPTPLQPEDGGVAVGGYVAFAPLTPHPPDFWNVQIYQLPATLVWEVTIPGSLSFFQLPEFPDFGELPPEERPAPYEYGGDLYMTVTGARIGGFDFDRHEYLNDIRARDRWYAWTRSAWVIRFE